MNMRNKAPITLTGQRKAFLRLQMFPLVVATTTFFLGPVGGSAQTHTRTNKPTLYYIPHTHWEGAVFKTREDYLAMGMPRTYRCFG